MQQKTIPILSGSKLRYLLLLNLSAFFIFIGLYGRDAGYYTSSQINLFLEINKDLCVTPKFWLNITMLGDVAVLLPILSLAVFRNTRLWASLIGSIPLALLLTHGGKLLFKIPRPAAIIDNSYFKITGGALKGFTSLPSGHTLTIFAAVTVLLYFLIFEKKTAHPVLWSILLILVASVVAISRITVGAHWPVDVLAGAVLGGISGMSGVYLSNRYTSWWRWMNNVKYAQFHIITILLFLYAFAIREQFLAIYWLPTIVGAFVITNLIAAKLNYRWTLAYS
jgi:membrane-associated phospholipid phosphatase